MQKIRRLLTFENVLISAILLVAFILRVYRVDKILGFYYDQGRDALVIWDLIHSPHKLFLIGPTTGLAGVFRGPFYYYLIAPFYLLGKGSPLYPEVFLALTSVTALIFMYLLAKEIGGKLSGFIALFLGTFSFEIIYASRWLSNPTPMLLLSMLLVWSMFKIYDGKRYYWIILSFILGLSFFHFGSSGELFYFPGVAIFAVWIIIRQGFGNVKSTLNWKVVFMSLAIFIVTFSPLFIFNLRHGNILENNIGILLTTGKSFAIPTWRFIEDRSALIITYFSANLFHAPAEKEHIITGLFFLISAFFLNRLIKNDKFKILLLLLSSVFLGLIFFQGNFGNLYQYYLTGYYLIFLITVAVILAATFRSSLIGKLIVAYFLFFFLTQNWSWVRPYINTTGTEPNMIILSNQEKVISWVYQNANGRDFNVDVYVPPVISYSYDYLFKWLGTSKYHKLPETTKLPLLYTIYEADPDHPDRLAMWLARQKGIGTVVKEEIIGGLTVQERERIKYD